MTPEATTAFVAHSQPKVVILLAMGVATIYFAYMGLSAFDTSVPVIGLFRLGRPPQALGIVFVILAALSLAATVWQIRRRFSPNADVVMDAEGIAIRQSFSGRGRLAWSEVTWLESKRDSLLYIHGISATGDAERLVIDMAQIDVAAADLYAAIACHRPDLVKMPGS
jgi:membrane protein implicated in regulation of membrane protease activity